MTRVIQKYDVCQISGNEVHMQRTFGGTGMQVAENGQANRGGFHVLPERHWCFCLALEPISVLWTTKAYAEREFCFLFDLDLFLTEEPEVAGIKVGADGR